MSNDISTDVQYIGSYPPRQTKEMKRKLSPPEEKNIKGQEKEVLE